MLLIKKICKLFTFPWSDQWLLFQSAVWLILIKLGLHLLRFQKLRQTLLLIPHASKDQREISQTEMNKVIWAIERTAKYLPGDLTCLPQALTTQTMLRRRGYQTELMIGVKQGSQGETQAHAWVEAQGKVLIGDLENLSKFRSLQNFEVKHL